MRGHNSAQKSQPGSRSDYHEPTRFSRNKFAVLRRIIEVTVSRSSSPEVCHVHSGSLEAGRSRVGIAERHDICWFRCIVGT